MSHAIVCCGVGGWYEMGAVALKASLMRNHFRGAMYIHVGEYPPGSPTHQDVPYAFKLMAIEHARNQGHQQVLWLDASAWAIGKLDPVFNRIEEDGHYFWTSGFNCAQWCNDRSLAYFGVTREQAAQMEMLYALVIGLDFQSDRTCEFFEKWKKAGAEGVFNGSWKREPGDQEAEPYCGHRHDQSAASIIAHQLGMGIDGTMDLCRLYQPNAMPGSVALTFQGL